jgi:hypothetical protein
MFKFIGNSLNAINWNTLIDNLKTQPGRLRGFISDDIIKNGSKKEEIKSMWFDASYDNNKCAGWFNHAIPVDVKQQFAEFVNVDPIGGWITSVPPGYVVPWHYDIDNDQQEYYKIGIPTRFTCHISRPAFGHVFILGHHAFTDIPQGNVYEWTDWQEWHGGLNMGIETKYLFNFLGYKKQ